MTESEVDIAERNVRHDILGLKKDVSRLRRLMGWLLLVVFGALAVISAAGIVTVTVSSDTKSVGQQNRAFLTNFSDYMRCLVINDDQVVVAYGEEAYFNICDELLFRNTGLKPSHFKVTLPSTTTSTIPETTVTK
jgi:hypothetical protein